MRTLTDLQNMLSGFKDFDFKLFYSVLCEKINTEEDFLSKMEICKYIKNNYQYEKNDVFDKIFDLEKQYFKYIENKVNLKYGKKQWQKMIDYLDLACQYFVLDDSNIVFDSFYDYFLYITINPQTTKDLTFKMGIEGWAYFKYGVAYSRLKRYDLAEKNLNCCLKCSPMSFVAYVELFKLSYEQNDFLKLKKYLDKSYNLAKISQDLGSYFYYYTLYAYHCNNYQLAKAICQISMGLDIMPAERNKLLEIFNDVMQSDKIISSVFVTNPVQVLKQNNVPIWFSYEIMSSTLVLYKACLSRLIENKTIQSLARKSLNFYRLKDYMAQIETNVLTNQNMYMFENCGISVELNKKWQVRFKSMENSTAGILLEAVDGDNTLTIIYDSNPNNYDFNTLCQENLKKLNIANFKTLNQKEIYTINKKNIMSFIVEEKVCMMFTKVFDKFFIVSIDITSKKEEKIKELYKIIDTLRPFNSILLKYIFENFLKYDTISKMKKNIVILGMNYKYNLNIGELLSQSTDMYFLDVEEFINYRLISKIEMLEKCGIDYLTKQENTAVKSCAEFEKTIICMPYTYFFRDKMYQNFLQNSYLIYLYFSKDAMEKSQDASKTFDVDMLVFEERNADFLKVCNKKIDVDSKDIDTVVNEIINLRGEYEY